jgi:phosphatidylinositol glycan class S
MTKKKVSDSKRFWVILSMFIFVLCNVPIWWNTTGAYQTNLPHDAIQSVSDQYLETGTDLSKCVLPLRLQLVVVGFKLNEDDILSINAEQEESIKRVLIKTNEQDIDDELNKIIGSMQRGLYRLVIMSGKGSKLFIGKYRHAWVSLPPEQITQVPSIVQAATAVFALQMNHHMTHVKVKPALDYRLTFTLLNQDPSTSLLRWDFPSIERKYLRPLLKKLEPLARFQVDSQIMHYGNLPSRPIYNQALNRYHIHANDIQYLLNANDWQFESPALNETSLQFLLLSPSKTYSPLKIINYNSNEAVAQDAFIIPRWGGVYVYNGQEKQNNTPTEYTNLEDVQTVIQIFVEQFRILIGLPPSADKLQNIQILPSLEHGIADWEIDSLIRIRALHHLTTATHSLRSLSKLVHQMPNVMVMEDVAHLTESSLSNIQDAMKSCDKGDYNKTLEHAKIAVYASEHAFFHPSMLSLLYFPNSQKLAVYLPLVLPAVFTVTMALVRELRTIRQKNIEAKRA